MNGFDSWEAELYHWGIKGMKHGRRRYQNEDGTWTPLGLKERRAREGFGEREEAKAQKKAAKAAAKAEKAKRIQEKIKASNPKYYSDEELKKRIERLKLEQEYKELNKSGIVKTAEHVVKAYIDAKEAKEKAANNRIQQQINMTKAKVELKKATSQNNNARSALIDSVTGTNWMKSKSELAAVRNETAKRTIKGAIQQSVSNLIRQESHKVLKESSGKPSVLKRTNKVIKKYGKKAYSEAKDLVKDTGSAMKKLGKAGSSKVSEAQYDLIKRNRGTGSPFKD